MQYKKLESFLERRDRTYSGLWLTLLVHWGGLCHVKAQATCTWPDSFPGGPTGISWTSQPAPTPPTNMQCSVELSPTCGQATCSRRAPMSGSGDLATVVCPAGWYGDAQAQCRATWYCGNMGSPSYLSGAPICCGPCCSVTECCRRGLHAEDLLAVDNASNVSGIDPDMSTIPSHQVDDSFQASRQLCSGTHVTASCLPQAVGTTDLIYVSNSYASLCNLCPAGSYCPAGATGPIVCPAGVYGSSPGLSTASCSGACLAGYWGASGQTSSTCSGQCSAGYWCDAGSSTITQYECPMGSFCPAGATGPTRCPIGSFCPTGAAEPTTCPAGVYGSSQGLSTASCTGTCLAGYWGASGQTSSTCSGQCSAGYWCDAGSSTAAQYQCPIGSYCPAGASGPTPCPAGVYGLSPSLSTVSCSGPCLAGYWGTSGQTSSTCSGRCSAGYWCDAGSSAATQYQCPAGSYCPSGATGPTLCPAGVYGSSPGLSAASCTGPCLAGYWGTSGETSSTCSGLCSAGYWCDAGSSTATQFQCPIGSYCPAGATGPTLCPAGVYGSSQGLSTASCTGPCLAGYWCGSGSTSPTRNLCPAGYFCPLGAANAQVCPIGSYCLERASEPSACPAGTYGTSEGMSSSQCSGQCACCPSGASVPVSCSPNPSRSASTTQVQSVSQSSSVSSSETRSASQPASSSVSPSQVRTVTQSQSQSSSVTITASLSQTPSLTATLTQKATPSQSLTTSESGTASLTYSQSPSQNPSASQSQSQIQSRSQTSSPSLSQTASNSQSDSPSDTQTPSLSQTMTPSDTLTPSQSTTKSSTQTSSSTVSPSQTQSRSGTSSATLSASATGTSSQSESATQTQSRTLTMTPSMTLSRSPSTTVTASETQSSTASQSFSQSVTPTQSCSQKLTPTQSQTLSPSSRPFALRLLPVERMYNPSPDIAIVSDSIAPLVFDVAINRCPGPSQGVMMHANCLTTSIGYATDNIPGSSPTRLFTSVSFAKSASDVPLTCDENARLPDRYVKMGLFVSIGAIFGTGGGTSALVCELFSAESSLGRGVQQLSVTPTRWPRWVDAILTSPGSVLMRSAVLQRTMNSTETLCKSGSPCRVESLLAPSVALQTARALWSEIALPRDAGVPQPFYVTLTGSSWLFLRAVPGAFTNMTVAMLGSANCTLLAVSTDGAWAVFETPKSSAVCGPSAAERDCGYVVFSIKNQPDVFSDRLNVSTPDYRASYASGSPGIAHAYRGAVLQCPPFCAQGSDFMIPSPTASSAADEFVLLSPAIMPGNKSSPPIPFDPPVTTSEGFYIAARCAQSNLYTDPISGACANSSDPASFLCAYGGGDECSLCQSNALCPGGFRMWPRAGAWAAGDASGLRVIDCPAPSSERCLGFNVSTGQTQCGIGYLQGSYLCSACAPRYFTDFYGTCAACPAVATLWQRFSMLVWIVVVILGAVVAVYAFLVGLVWIVGGTLTGGVFRAINLALWCLMTAQVFSDVAAVASPSAPPLLRTLYNSVIVLQMQGLVLPPACTQTFPLETEAVAMSAALVLWLTVVIIFYAAPMRSRFARLVGQYALIGSFVMYPSTVVTVLGLLNCQVVTLAARSAAALDGGSFYSKALGVVDISVMTQNPFFICWSRSGSHYAVGILAAVTLPVYIAGLPIVTFGWLWINPWLRSKLYSAAPVQRLVALQAPRSDIVSSIDPKGQLSKHNPIVGSRNAAALENAVVLEEAPLDPIIEVFFFDYRPAAWYQRHAELGLLLVLSLCRALLPRPVDLKDIVLKCALSSIALAASLIHVLLKQPFIPSERWMGWMRATLLFDSIMCTSLNAAVSASDIGFGGTRLRNAVTIGSTLLFVACCVTICVLLCGFAWHMYTQAVIEQRVITARQGLPYAKPFDLSISDEKNEQAPINMVNPLRRKALTALDDTHTSTSERDVDSMTTNPFMRQGPQYDDVNSADRIRAEGFKALYSNYRPGSRSTRSRNSAVDC